MASKVLSIEIGYSLTKICEMDYLTKYPKVYRGFSMKTPENTVDDGMLNITEEFITQFKEALKANKVKTKQVVFTISSTKIATREVFIPLVKENRIAGVVKANAGDYFPVDLSQYRLAHTVLGVIGEQKGEQQYKVQVMAAPITLIKNYEALAQRCDLTLMAIDYSGNSIYQVVRSECTEGVQMVIKVDERSAVVTVLKNQAIDLQRAVSYGVDDAIQTMIDQGVYGDALSYEEALQILRRRTCIRKTFDSMDIENGVMDYDLDDADELDEDRQILLAKVAITQSLQYMIGGVVRVMDYYNSRNSEKPIERIYLTGLGGDFGGLSKLMANELGMHVVLLSNITEFNIEKNFKDLSFGEYLSCFGAAIAPLGFMAEGARSKGASDEESGKSKGKKGVGTAAYLLFSLGLLAAIGLIGYPGFRYYTAQAERNRLMERRNELAYVEQVYNKYLNTKALYDDINAMYALTETHNEYFTDFIAELEQKMPSTIQVVAITASGDAVSINMVVPSKVTMATVISRLRSFDSVAVIDVASATIIQDDETGMENVSFSVNCTYKNLTQRKGGAQ